MKLTFETLSAPHLSLGAAKGNFVLNGRLGELVFGYTWP
jgi:hypothetical protein